MFGAISVIVGNSLIIPCQNLFNDLKKEERKTEIHAKHSEMVCACHHLWELVSTSSLWVLGI